MKKKGLLERISNYFDKNTGPLQAGAANGEGQWQWLEQQLEEAEVRILLSEMPFIAPQNGYPSWALFAGAEAPVCAVKKPGCKPCFIGSWWYSLWTNCKAPQLLDYPVWQISSGTINRDDETPYRFNQRQGAGEPSTRFGMIEIMWLEQPTVTLSLRDVNGRSLYSTTINLSELQ